MPNKITLLLPLPPKELNPNARVHYQARARAAAQYREDVIVALWGQGARRNFWRWSKEDRFRITETYRIAGRRRHDVRNLFAAFKAGEDALCPPTLQAAGAGLLPGDDDSVLEHGPPRIERVKSKAEEGVLVEIEALS